MYEYLKEHIPRTTPNNRRPGHPLIATTITIHNTANPTSSARNERNWLVNPSNTVAASYHIVIDQGEVIECIPLNEVAWHAGDGSKAGSGNRTSIGIEICESGNYSLALDNAAELVASLLLERGWGVDRLRRHYDWSGKNCPRLMNDDGSWEGWAKFKAKVETKLAADRDENSNEEDDSVMTSEDANNIIHFLSAAYMATPSLDARKEFNRLANELRRSERTVSATIKSTVPNFLFMVK